MSSRSDGFIQSFITFGFLETGFLNYFFSGIFAIFFCSNENFWGWRFYRILFRFKFTKNSFWYSVSTEELKINFTEMKSNNDNQLSSSNNENVQYIVTSQIDQIVFIMKALSSFYNDSECRRSWCRTTFQKLCCALFQLPEWDFHHCHQTTHSSLSQIQSAVLVIFVHSCWTAPGTQFHFTKLLEVIETIPMELNSQNVDLLNALWRSNDCGALKYLKKLWENPDLDKCEWMNYFVHWMTFWIFSAKIIEGISSSFTDNLEKVFILLCHGCLVLIRR